MTNVTFILDV